MCLKVVSCTRYCDSVSVWEHRRGASRKDLPDTRRKSLGVTGRGHKNPIKAEDLPEVLQLLGEKVAKFCKAKATNWCTCTDLSDSSRKFEQVYIQRYTAGPEQSLGFHHDCRSGYSELVCGITVSGSGKFLLSSTTAGPHVKPKHLEQQNVAVVPLAPRSLYVMTGMARYDLRHAAEQCGTVERISLTFRCLKTSKSPTRRKNSSTTAATTDATDEGTRAQIDSDHYNEQCGNPLCTVRSTNGKQPGLPVFREVEPRGKSNKAANAETGIMPQKRSCPTKRKRTIKEAPSSHGVLGADVDTYHCKIAAVAARGFGLKQIVSDLQCSYDQKQSLNKILRACRQMHTFDSCIKSVDLSKSLHAVNPFPQGHKDSNQTLHQIHKITFPLAREKWLFYQTIDKKNQYQSLMIDE